MESLPVLLGVLKTGAAFIPLDSDYPIAFLEEIVLDCKPDLFIIDNENKKGCSLLADKMNTLLLTPELFYTSTLESTYGNAPADFPLSHPACILYTSGSMGKPKGVVIPHKAIAHQISWCQEHFTITPSDKQLQKSPCMFVVSLREYFWPICYGASVVFA